MNYKKLIDEDIVIASGIIEGAASYVVKLHQIDALDIGCLHTDYIDQQQEAA